MARNGSGIYSLPGTYQAVSGETIEAQQHNDPLEDLASDANVARPIVAGGTGAQSAAGARTALAAAGTGDINTFSKIQKWAKGADVASANALTLGDDGNYFDITGTTAITSIATKGAGTVVKLHFDAALTLTYDATALILPGAANITTAAGDEAEFIEYATGNWRCLNYQFNSANVSVGGTLSVTGAATLGGDLTLSSGDIIVNASTFATALVQANAASGAAGAFDYSAADGSGSCISLNRSSSNGAAAVFYRGGISAGSISVSASGTVYNTTSDRRLKQNIIDLPNASDVIDALTPRQFEFIANPGVTIAGFVAQELETVVPSAVTDGSGNPGDQDFMPKSVDQSRLIPFLVAEIKSLRNRIAAIEAKNIEADNAT